MAYNFRDKRILIVNDDPHSRKLLAGVLRVVVVKQIDEAYESTQAHRVFNEGNHDVIVADITTGANDAIHLAKLIRNDAASPNAHVPIIAICGPRAMHLVDAARDAGISELIRAPYSSKIISESLNYIFSLDSQQLQQLAEPQEPPTPEAIEAPQTADWPTDDEEAFSITHMLLDHYMKHNEIVLAKLRFAQDATKKCISEIRNTYEKVKDKDNTDIAEFKDFGKMWEEIIALFINGGLSEEEILNIEKTITTIPKDIKAHYDDLSHQDKSFMALVENLNGDAYQKAKEKVMGLHKTPNPLNGKTIDDYAVQGSSEISHKANDDEFAYIVDPKKRKT